MGVKSFDFLIWMQFCDVAIILSETHSDMKRFIELQQLDKNYNIILWCWHDKKNSISLIF